MAPRPGCCWLFAWVCPIGVSVCGRDQKTIHKTRRVVSSTLYVCERGSSWFVLVRCGWVVIAALAVSKVVSSYVARRRVTTAS